MESDSKFKSVRIEKLKVMYANAQQQQRLKNKKLDELEAGSEEHTQQLVDRAFWSGQINVITEVIGPHVARQWHDENKPEVSA